MTKPAPKETRSSLERQDWVDAAYKVLVQEGVGRVRVLNLAEALGITRGSFYWHFRNREELLDELVKVWQQKNTGALLEACSSSADFIDRMFALVECWTNEHRYDPALDAAMRHWATQDARILQLVQEEDSKRLQAFQRMFEDRGVTGTEAMIRARVFYFTQVGYFALGMEHTEPLVERLALFREYYLVFTGEPVGEANEARYQQYVGKLLHRK